ncbi:uncharacterized protein MELLADRAFT_111723 [Melampsora larici-populina 98AG31]|uniref:Alpha-type protein kinase domain-containing protein n=1 Tax=Melampsora larici-populina (strain 98AG31 / pathotype 3-4-7) TaxID=747676 RepID=F4S4B6_MELLP|nr:uncharacterized protein MELLADRAFT_111723 [Melampsora larici-populina 98AG31]EGG00495.1 hypothetical protein MELLADRAFT_111723 [Melampsora larici-populina 98AG31]
MPSRNNISMTSALLPYVNDGISSLTNSDPVSESQEATTAESTPPAATSLTTPAENDYCKDGGQGMVNHKSHQTQNNDSPKDMKTTYNIIPTINKISRKAARAPQAIQTPALPSGLVQVQQKPPAETKVVVKKETNHTPPINFENWGPVYKPSEKYELTTSYVGFEAVGTDLVGHLREFNNWIFRKIEFHASTVENTMIGKHHRRWPDNSISVAREEAMELAQANVYVAMMLEQFQHALRDCKTAKAISMKSRNFQTESQLLKVSPTYILQPIGALSAKESSWVVCQAPWDSSHVSYVHQYKFRSNDSQHKRWKNLVHVFLHFINHRSGGKTLVVKLDCNRNGHISGLHCFDKDNSQHLVEDSDEIQRAFKHFVEDHQCNQVCVMLKMAPIISTHAKSADLV